MNKVKDFTIALAGTIVRVTLVILAAFCIMNFAGKAYDFGYRIFAEEPMSEAPGRDITVTVTSGDSQSEIIQMLEDKGLIRDHMIFTVQKRLSIYTDDIEPGTYVLNTSMTNEEMLAILVGEPEDKDDESEDGEELDEVDDELSSDMTGLDSAGVLGEDSEYDESAAFEDESSYESEGTGDEYEGEGDEESAIEE